MNQKYLLPSAFGMLVVAVGIALVYIGLRGWKGGGIPAPESAK